MTTGPTDAAPRERFEADGYLVLEDFFPSDEAATLIARADELVAAFKPDEVTRSIFSTNEHV